ncbi:MAG: hypothetical protein ACR2GS_06120, partial [Thermomicrobiales bacterium]
MSHDDVTPTRTLNRRELVAGAGLAASASLLPSGAAFATSMIRQDAPTLPANVALVTSPRLPLWDITGDAATRILDGSAATWADVGCPLSVPIRRLMVDGVDSLGMTTEETVAGYEALVIAMEQNPGAVAVVPLDRIDTRVTALRIDGNEP